MPSFLAIVMQNTAQKYPNEPTRRGPLPEEWRRNIDEEIRRVLHGLGIEGKIDFLQKKESPKSPKLKTYHSIVSSFVLEKKECWYFPYCLESNTECGGSVRGHCKNVLGGTCELPDHLDKLMAIRKRAST